MFLKQQYTVITPLLATTCEGIFEHVDTSLLAVGEQFQGFSKVTPLLAVGQWTHCGGILEPLQIMAWATDSSVRVWASYCCSFEYIILLGEGYICYPQVHH